MLDFQGKSSENNKYLRRNAQRKMLWVIMGAGLSILLLVNLPYLPMMLTAVVTKFSPPAEVELPPKQVPQRDQKPAGTIIIKREKPQPVEEEATAAEDLAQETEEVELSSLIELGETRGEFPSLSLGELAKIQDGMMRQKDERPMFYGLLAILNNHSTKQIEDGLKASGYDAFIAYRQLMQQPDQYRGELVRFNGTVRAAFEHEAEPNPFGIQKYYKLWVSNVDHQHVMMLYCLELPEGFPISKIDLDGSYTQIDEPITSVAYFFKISLYLSNGGAESTPMLLAKSITWQKQEEAAEAQAETEITLSRFAIASGIIFLIASGFVAFVFISTEQKARSEAQQFTADIHTESLETLSRDVAEQGEAPSLDDLAKTMPAEVEPWEHMAQGDQSKES